MKLSSIFLIKSSIILALILVSNTLESKKEISMMEFMNSFYSSDKKAEELVKNSLESSNTKTKSKKSTGQLKAAKKRHKKNHLKLKSRKNKHLNDAHFRFKSSQNNTNSTDSSKCNAIVGDYDQILRQNFTNDTEFPRAIEGITIEGQLFVASSAFRNRERFPPVILPNGTVQEIQIDPEMFRINTQNCEDLSCKLNFWFRLAPNLHLYYASTEKDLNVLGAISIKNINNVGDPLSPIITTCGESYCFEIEDTVNSNWKLCAKSWKRAMLWICAIKQELNISDVTCDFNGKVNVQIIEKRIKEPIIIIPLPSKHCNEGWSYQVFGDDWECDCKEGIEQSPIDLPEPTDSIDSPLKPLFAYNEVSARGSFDTIDKQIALDMPLKIKLYQGALRIFHHNFGKVTTLDGAVYYAEEIVFHTPSEHTINGKKYDMEVQIIHYGQSKGDIAKQLVLSFLVEKKPGIYNSFFDDLDVFNLPDTITREKDINNNLYIPKFFFRSDSKDIPMMKLFSFYTYQGSLTFPPCSERTIVYVASKPIELSSTSVQLYQEALRIPDLVDQKGNIITSEWNPVSARRVQERRGRPVFYYDHVKYCGPDPNPKKPKKVGHYEKVIQRASNFFYVNGDKPSGLPGAFVVSEKEAKGQYTDLSHKTD